MRKKLPGIVALKAFERAAAFMTDAERQRLDMMLAANPEIGVVMEGTGGVRKVRLAVGGKGKSGGARVIYYYRSNVGRVYLMTAFQKGEKDNLTKEQRNTLKQLTKRLDSEP
jgi:hypothetical protein